jgi:glycosyltransferase involved in cell wall biosynthesis
MGSSGSGDSSGLQSSSSESTKATLKLFFFIADYGYFLSHRLPIALAASRSGYDVSLVTPVRDHDPEIVECGIRLVPIKLNRGGINIIGAVSNILWLTRLYMNEKPDVVHHVGLKPIIFGSIAAMLAGVRSVVNALAGRGHIFHSRDRRAALLRLLAGPALRFVLNRTNTRVIVQNSSDYEWIVHSGYAKANSVRLILGSGVDLSNYYRDRESADVPLAILPARLLHEKGVVEFVIAARLLRSKGIAARFALVGKPDSANPSSITDKHISAWVDEGSVEAWGWRIDMPAIFANAQIVCLPSYHEGLPKCLLEAAASGCGIVASDIPGCREIVISGETGWLVPPRDPRALAVALEEAIVRPDLRARYGNAARDRVRTLFSGERFVEDTLRVYRELLQQVK